MHTWDKKVDDEVIITCDDDHCFSEQKDFGYSDVTLTNMQNKGRIREHFAWANKKFSMIRAVEEKNNCWHTSPGKI